MRTVPLLPRAVSCLLLAGCGTPGLPDARDVLPVPELVATWTGHTAPVHALSVSPDGEALVSASDDGTLRLWNVATGGLRAVLSGHGDKVWAAAFVRDGREVVSGGLDGVVKRWDAARGVELASSAPGSMATGIASLVWSPAQRRVVTGGFDSMVRLWSLDDMTAAPAWQGHGDTVWAVAFAADGRRAFSGSFDGSIRVWDTESGACLATWTEADVEQRGWKRALALGPEGTTLLAGGSRRIREWQVASGTEAPPFRGEHEDSVLSLAVSRDGRFAASGGFDGHLHLWDLQRRASVARWPAGQGDGVWAVAFLADGRLVSAGDTGAIRVWRVVG